MTGAVEWATSGNFHTTGTAATVPITMCTAVIRSNLLGLFVSVILGARTLDRVAALSPPPIRNYRLATNEQINNNRD